MKAMRKLRLLQQVENTNEFTDGEITITTGRLAFYHGKHHMSDPQNARAVFIRLGKRYIMKNNERIATVEDWYKEELLPKFLSYMPMKPGREDNRPQDQF